jgi:antitoxin component of RelBE/YafQ-DinJ toxin-antitoxin module
MKISPLAPNASVAQTPQTSQNTSARERAIAKLTTPPAPTQGQAQETPVANPNNISPEELSAVRPSDALNAQEQGLDASQDQVQGEVEAPPQESAKTEPKQDTAASKQWAQLARQERALRAKAQQQEQALKAREAALAAREAELTAKDTQYSQGYVSKDRLKQDALTVLTEAGLSYDDIVQQALNQTPRDPRLTSELQSLKAEIQALRQANENTQKSYQEQQQDAYKAAVKQIETDVRSLVQSDPNAYEAIAKTGSIKEVVNLIERVYQQDGVVMSVEEATEEVENYLVDESFKTLSRIEKIKKKLMPSVATTPKADVKIQANSKQTPSTMKTLTNAASSSRKLSAKERAILAFKGELKS